ncbi:hypothetical protein C8D77_1011707 [Mesorhizobium loti]|jgi:hypothetical protein|uniref:Uncharacterized protein n=1 Tax=Rhizobium loti TaxID=381 RepID=A0A8E2WL44_RHILI|nr:hypothetical protein [Mesorhizobium loti]PWJ95019.1 hypothetical protein C8D77_1011707 [Mesorhizobium loti]
MRLRTIPAAKGSKSLTFKANSTACLKVGELIYRAATDKAEFDKFAENPNLFLEQADIKPSQLADLTIKVVRDKKSVVHIVIPVVNESKGGLKKYLRELGFVTIMGCK